MAVMGRAALLSIAIASLAAACRSDESAVQPPPAPPPVPPDAAARTADAPAEAPPDALGGSISGDPGRPGGGTAAALDPRRTSCPHPAIGVWVAKTYADGESRWHEHRLSIAAGPDDDELVVQQTTRIWNGTAADSLPALCPRGGPAWGIYEIHDKGRFVDGILHVWGVEVARSYHTCEGVVLSYNLDSFTGRVHRDVYKARNNDGSMAVNRPYHFRRIACTPD